MADAIFNEPRLASVYDPLDPDRSDLEVYAQLAVELEARSVVDIGCGTGTFACLLARRGLDVVGVDPAEAMLAVARHKDGADRVRWIHGTATDVPAVQADLVTMTANVAQVFLDDDEWVETLVAARRVLRPDGSLVFETRRPEREAWLEWNREQSHQRVHIDGAGIVETWNELVAVDLPFVTFRGTIIFHADGSVLVSESTLRFRSVQEVIDSLVTTGFDVSDVRDAPDRPGNEYVFVAVRR
jgi:ubiquinone/menaquinone biosynthesis C-methylase UbiE